jgi:nitroreductase
MGGGAVKRRFFKFSRNFAEPRELNAWFEHFVRQGICCYIAAGRRGRYSLWVEGEDANTEDSETAELELCGDNIAACFLPLGAPK